MSHPLASAVEMFEGESERLLWLPAITLGYVYTLSGAPTEFIFAVLAIGGARLFGYKLDSDLVTDAPEGPRFREDVLEVLQSSYPLGKSWLLGTVAVGYAVSAIIAVYGLYQFFDHTNLILVALGLTWSGAALIVVLNY